MTDFLVTLQQTLGDRYTIERELSGGGMSRVFLAQERGLPRRVALKVLPPELRVGVSVDRFRREIQLVASLQHPHIVPLLAAGEAGDLIFYTMPFVEGETLRARLAREKRLPTGERARDALERLDPTRVRPSAQPSVYFSAHDALHGIIRTYLLGLLDVNLGDLAAAQESATRLERETGPATASTLPRDLALEIRAGLAARAHEPAAALGFLRRTENYSWYEYHFASPLLSMARQRYVRAGLEAAAGDTARALALFGAFENYSPYDLIYAAPGHLHRASLYERLGNIPAARAEYMRFLEMWQGCDPEFRALLDSARTGLARLSGTHSAATAKNPPAGGGVVRVDTFHAFDGFGDRAPNAIQRQ